jgi:hypothetical protein
LRYFTRAWCRGECTDEEFDEAVAAYGRRLDEITIRLLPDLRALSRISLNDAWFKSVIIDRTTHRLVLRLRCGDIQIGYFDLLLHYDEATIRDGTLHGVENLPNVSGTEVLYDEVDELGPGRFEHRMILWPQGELAIQFAAFTLARVAVPSRESP